MAIICDRLTACLISAAVPCDRPQAIPQPEMIIASDAIPYVDGKAHPRGAGCFCKVLREFVREKKAMPLMQALRQMSLLP